MPAKRLDPNRAHLLVITFYESGREVGDFKLQGTRYVRVVDGEETGSFTLPHRRLRRVICRMLILPAGFSPVMEKNASVFEEVWSKIDGVIGDAVQRVSNWITRGAGSVAKAPFWAAKKAGEVGCAGLEKVDKITALQFSPEEVPETSHAGSGILVANESVRAKRRGLDACFRVAAPVEVDCDPGADIVYRGRCTALSKPRLYIEKGEFLDLEGKDEGIGYKRYETVRIDATPPPDEHTDTGVIGSYRGAVIDEGDGVYRAWDKAPGGAWRMRTIKVHDSQVLPCPFRRGSERPARRGRQLGADQALRQMGDRQLRRLRPAALPFHGDGGHRPSRREVVAPSGGEGHSIRPAQVGQGCSLLLCFW